MPKGSLNPADAYRKAQRKKELKKNKADRAKARDFALVKKDTTELEEEINQLESTNSDKTRLVQLKTELEKISKKKEEYVKEHPEQRNLVYRRHRKHADDNTTAQPSEPAPQKRNLFNKKGLPRHPERSLYYDPVLNPFGVPPPGMPYRERPLRPDEVDSDPNDADVPLLSAPPAGYELVESDDEIFLPEGPPSSMQPPPLTQPSSHSPPGFPIGNVTPLSSFPPIVPHMVPPPPIPGFPPGAVMFPPPGVPFYPHPSLPSPAHPPPLPPGFFPRNQSLSAIQDPLSSIPHTTYQAHRIDQYASHSILPSNPSLPPKPTAAAELANATVVAAPQLRDFHKEATAFLPKSLMKKKPGSATTVKSQVNAAPPLELAVPGNKEQDEKKGSPAASACPDLVGVLKSQFAAARTLSRQPSDVKKGKAKKNDDYEKFMDEMSDIL